MPTKCGVLCGIWLCGNLRILLGAQRVRRTRRAAPGSPGCGFPAGVWYVVRSRCPSSHGPGVLPSAADVAPESSASESFEVQGLVHTPGSWVLGPEPPHLEARGRARLPHPHIPAATLGPGPGRGRLRPQQVTGLTFIFGLQGSVPTASSARAVFSPPSVLWGFWEEVSCLYRLL